MHLEGGSLLPMLDRRPGAGEWDEEIAEGLLELAMRCIRRQPRMRYAAAAAAARSTHDFLPFPFSRFSMFAASGHLNFLFSSMVMQHPDDKVEIHR